MKKLQLIAVSVLLIGLVFLGGHGVHAQSIGGTSSTGSIGGTPSTGSIGGTGLTNPLQVSSISALIAAILGYVVKIGAIFLTLMLIFTGYKFIEARGNEEKVSGARTALLWTIVGGLLLLGAQVIANAIAATIQAL